MNVEIGAEAALFPEKEYINGIFVAVQADNFQLLNSAIWRSTDNFQRLFWADQRKTLTDATFYVTSTGPALAAKRPPEPTVGPNLRPAASLQYQSWQSKRRLIFY